MFVICCPLVLSFYIADHVLSFEMFSTIHPLGQWLSTLVLESHRVCWVPHSWSWRATGCAGVLTPGPGEPQDVLGSSLLVLERHRVCWGPQPWTWRAAGCAGILNPHPGEQG